jgi:hypothetical protein
MFFTELFLGVFLNIVITKVAMFSHLLVVLPGGLSMCRFSPVTSRNNMTAVKFIYLF